MQHFKPFKALVKAVALAMLTASVQAQTQVLPEINWQQNPAQIKQQHTQATEEENQRKLSYASQLFDMSFNQEYLFNAGQLIEVLYYRSFSPDTDTCLTEYRQLKAKLEQQYGATDTTVNTQLDTSNLSEQTLCHHSAKGEYLLNSQWQNNNAAISFVLSTWKGQSYLGLSYRPLPSQ